VHSHQHLHVKLQFQRGVFPGQQRLVVFVFIFVAALLFAGGQQLGGRLQRGGIILVCGVFLRDRRVVH